MSSANGIWSKAFDEQQAVMQAAYEAQERLRRAAPSMLKALKAAAALFDDRALDTRARRVHATLKAAIRKAEGR